MNVLNVSIGITLLQRTKENIQEGLNIKSFALSAGNIQNIKRPAKRKARRFTQIRRINTDLLCISMKN